MGGSIGQLSGCYLSTIQNRDTKKELNKFNSWLAGIIDGDGNFDIRKQGGKDVLKAIRIKVHDRDMRILTRIKDELHVGRIRSEKDKPYSTYVVSTSEGMKEIVKEVNG